MLSSRHVGGGGQKWQVASHSPALPPLSKGVQSGQKSVSQLILASPMASDIMIAQAFSPPLPSRVAPVL